MSLVKQDLLTLWSTSLFCWGTCCSVFIFLCIFCELFLIVYIRLFGRFMTMDYYFNFSLFQCCPDIKRICPNALTLLVGTKKDLINPYQNDQEIREKDTSDLYAYETGINLAERIQAVKYIECSAKTGEGIKLVLQEAIKCVFNKTKQLTEKKSTCNVL